MSNDITLRPSIETDNKAFETYIEDFEINFKTDKGKFIGTFNTWNIALNLNKNNINIPENLKLKLKVNNNYYKMPTFILTPVSDEETTEDVKVKGYDRSILFDTDFEWTQTLPCTAGQLAQNICNKVGVPLKDTNFANNDFMIYSQVADNKRTNREIIAMIAAIAGGNAFINEDDKLEIRSFIESDLIVEEYFTSEKFVKVGPITGVNLAREPIKDYKELNDASLSAQYKSCMVKITNNLIVDNNRELALQPLYNKLHGLEFYCKKIETHEAYSVKPFSFIKCNDNQVLVDTICIKYPTLIDSYISSNQLTEVESNVSDKSKSLKQRIINAEAKVDEVKGEIDLIATEVTEHEDKLSEIKLDIDSITHKVENIAGITREVSGITKIKLEECMEGQLLELHIYGNNTVFDSQYLSDDLVLDDDVTIFGNSLIKVYSDDLRNNQQYCKEITNMINTIAGDVVSGTNKRAITLEYNSAKGIGNSKSLVLKVEPNKKYFFVIEKAQLEENEVYAIGTFTENIIDNPNRHLISNNMITNCTVDSEYNWIREKNKLIYEIETKENDNYICVYHNFSNIYNYISDFENLKIYESYKEIDLGIEDVLRQCEGVCDEYILKDNKAQIIRRIGVDSNNNKYILENEVIEDLGELIIDLAKGTNFIEILDYTANLKAKYVIINEFTTHFATTIEMHSLIQQLTQQIMLEVYKKIGKEEIIARINMAILGKDDAEIPEDIEKSIIEILANKISIKSDNFELTKNGVIKAVAGTIAGLNMNKEQGGSYLSKNYTNNGQNYQSGFYIPDTGSGTAPFLYAGLKTPGKLADASTYIRHDGLIKAKWFSVNGESGYFYINYDSNKRAMHLNKNGIYWYLDDDRNGSWFSFFKDTNGQWFSLYDAPFLGVYDGVHAQVMLNFYKYNPNSSNGERLGHIAAFSSRITCNGNRADGVNNSIYIQGYEVATNASDKRLKKRIKKSKDGALDIINKIKIKAFDWRKPRHHKRKHVDFGYIAQDTQEVLESLVDYDKINDKYQMNLLNLSALHTKAIQELSKENQELKQDRKSVV